MYLQILNNSFIKYSTFSNSTSYDEHIIYFPKLIYTPKVYLYFYTLKYLKWFSLEWVIVECNDPVYIEHNFKDLDIIIRFMNIYITITFYLS